MRAAWTTLGMPMVRVLRSNATLLRFALKRVMRTNASQREQIPEDLAAFQRLIVESMIDERAHQRLRLLLSLWIGIVVARHVEKRPAGHARLRSRVLDLDRSALGIVRIALRRIDRATARAVALERHGVTELLEQGSLERTQCGAELPCGASRRSVSQYRENKASWGSSRGSSRNKSSLR